MAEDSKTGSDRARCRHTYVLALVRLLRSYEENAAKLNEAKLASSVTDLLKACRDWRLLNRMGPKADRVNILGMPTSSLWGNPRKISLEHFNRGWLHRRDQPVRPERWNHLMC